MTVVLQLLLTAAAYGAVAWAIGGRFRDAARQAPKFDPAAGKAWRRPWLSYGLLLASAGLFLVMSDISLVGFGRQPHPLTFGLSALTILGGAAVCFYGLLDRYLLRRGQPELPSTRVRRLMEAFVAGAILLPTIAMLAVVLQTAGRPDQPPQSPPPQQRALD